MADIGSSMLFLYTGGAVNHAPPPSPQEIPIVPPPSPDIEPARRPEPEIPEPPPDPGTPEPLGPDITPEPLLPEVPPPQPD